MEEGRRLMRVLHANWTGGRLHLWAEDARRAGERLPELQAAAARRATGSDPGAETDIAVRTERAEGHPFACDASEIGAALRAADGAIGSAMEATLRLRLPTRDGAPAPSPKVAHAAGHTGATHEPGEPARLDAWSVPSLALDPADAMGVLERLEERLSVDTRGADPDAALLTLGASIRWFAAAARFVRSLVAEQRMVPMLVQRAGGNLGARWQPWWSDQRNAERLGRLLASVPPSVRAVIDEADHDPWTMLEDCLARLTDHLCRQALIDDQMPEAIEGWDATDDGHVAWLGGLLGPGRDAIFDAAHRSSALSAVRRWIGLLDDRGADVGWRLCLCLHEPPSAPDEAPKDIDVPGEDTRWRLTLHLQSAEREGVLLDAEEIWQTSADVVTVDGRRVEAPGELLLAELSRASRVYPLLERALGEEQPESIELTTREAHRFLAEIGPLLREQGVGVIGPEWWGAPSSRLGVLLHIDSEEERAPEGEEGLQSNVDYRWTLAIGETEVSISQLQQLAKGSSSLVRIGGRWVEIRPEDVAAAARFLRENPGGEMAVGELMRLAFASDVESTGVEIAGVEATGWVGRLLGLDGADQRLELDKQPEGLKGDLRPYQVRGLAWLAFLEQFGLGACLADDMGLGKTIQVLALLIRERELAGGKSRGPTLIAAPMSVVGNWRREAARFAPELDALIHHGVERLAGDAFVADAAKRDLVITTYALVHRDLEDLKKVPWRRVVLDEAQSVKNPAAKQSRAVHALTAPRRVALTGTPVENRLSELWSIMDFCNPGYLGSAHEFRRRFSVPIERRHDPRRSEQLRRLVRPFVLRRLKTDPTVIADLPEKLESKEYCALTSEQAALYEATVGRMLDEVDRAEGMRRRGAVLATLVKLKQICNHPAQALGEEDTGPPSAGRSGKAARIVEMLDEALSAGDQALVFTQFREMGKLLVKILTHELDREVLFLHGGTTQTAREAMIERFQAGKAPIFILSLKAGGLGMNLTAATHVFHFDRWWNPAVENQATDRAYRIGQTRSVQVHKFIVAGTLEERIDEMIEQKTELAENIIGAGESWLTEMSTGELRELLALRKEALVD
jgi:non-specific serine/threonine protein kinase